MDRRRVLIFGGTTEGRLLVKYCSKNRIPAYVSVATEYGGKLLLEDCHIKNDRYIKILTGAMDSAQMQSWMKEHKTELVVDATHPYARNVTANIKAACESEDVRYLRCLREEEDAGREGIVCSTAGEAAKRLEETTGNILVTTGSNELEIFAGSKNLRERMFVRVLPSVKAVGKCEELGISGSRLICMQGPFSKEMNLAMLRHVNAAFLVTKEAGAAGGFKEKLQAAREWGASVVVIGRPEETGESFSAVLQELHLFSAEGAKQGRRVVLAGIGPGSAALMTQEVKAAVKSSDLLVGAPRMLKAAEEFLSIENGGDGGGMLPAMTAAYLARDVMEVLLRRGDWRQATVLHSGDSGFYSGAGKIAERLRECGYDLTVLPGISSVSYFASRLEVSYDDALLATVHGRDFDVCGALRAGGRSMFLLTGGKNGAGEICRRLTEDGYGDLYVAVGENLSYPDERITCKTAGELSGREFAPLSLVFIVP